MLHRLATVHANRREIRRGFDWIITGFSVQNLRERQVETHRVGLRVGVF